MKNRKDIKYAPIEGFDSDCPCKGCEERFLACHDVCERYKEFKNVIDDYKSKMKKVKRNDYLYYCFEKKARRR